MSHTLYLAHGDTDPEEFIVARYFYFWPYAIYRKNPPRLRCSLFLLDLALARRRDRQFILFYQPRFRLSSAILCFRDRDQPEFGHSRRPIHLMGSSLSAASHILKRVMGPFLAISVPGFSSTYRPQSSPS